MTIRLDYELAEQLDIVAAVDAKPVSDVIRTALAAHIERRRHDDAFQTELRARLTRAEALLTDTQGTHR